MAARPTGRLFLTLQHLLPRRALTRLVYRLTRIRIGFVKNLTIRWFARHFGVDVAEAANDVPDGYRTFNDFFTRSLKAGARPLDDDPAAFVSPCDGTLSRFGEVRGNRLIQAKGIDYTLDELLGDAAAAEPFRDGRYATIYLAPYDYHRVHMPMAGRLTRERHCGTDLYSVNAATVAGLDRLFVRNERLIGLFETAAGPLAVILVGALNVGSITTAWGGETRGGIRAGAAPAWVERDVELGKGDLVGWFNMGSTVIVLGAGDALGWSAQLEAGRVLRMGERIATLPAHRDG